MGRVRLFDVRRHQWRPGAVRRALRLHHQSQFPWPPRPWRAHASNVAGDGRSRGGRRPSCRRPASAGRPQGLVRQTMVSGLAVRSRSIALSLAIACAMLSFPQALRADDYPSHPIKLLVGAPPGGTTDTIARSIAGPMAAALKQSVIVENRPGAGGNLAAEAVAKSAPDGYTLLVSFSSHTINASLYPKLPYDPASDFTAITKVATVPSLLVGNPKLPASDLNALIALAKAQPDKLTIGIGGIGSSLHLAGEKFKLMTGTHLLNVPYKGTAPALADVLGGQVDLMFISLVTGAEQVRAGNLRAYGVTTAQRHPSFPDLPAVGEA